MLVKLISAYQSMTRKYTRDTHLPHPGVCDWLLSLEWEGPFRAELRTPRFKGVRPNALAASAALGRDHMVELFIDEDDLAALKEDARARAAMAWLTENNP
jgi:hypothetical protein